MKTFKISVLVMGMVACWVVGVKGADVAVSALPNKTGTIAATDFFLVGDPVTKKAAFSVLKANLIGGATTQIQFNNAGSFGGVTNLVWDNANQSVELGSPTYPDIQMQAWQGGDNTDMGAITMAGLLDDGSPVGLVRLEGKMIDNLNTAPQSQFNVNVFTPTTSLTALSIGPVYNINGLSVIAPSLLLTNDATHYGSAMTPLQWTIFSQANAVNEDNGQILFRAIDDGGNTETYARFAMQPVENTDGAESGALVMKLRNAGGVFANNSWQYSFSNAKFQSTLPVAVPDDAYNAGTWDGSTNVPTKNAVRDKIEAMGTGSQGLSTNWVNGVAVVGVNLTNSASVTWTVSGTNVTASAAASSGAALNGTNTWTGTNTFNAPVVFNSTVTSSNLTITGSVTGTNTLIGSANYIGGDTTISNHLTIVSNVTAAAVSVSGAVASATLTTGGIISTNTVQIVGAADPTTDAAGETSFDNNAWAASRGALEVFDGTASTWLLGVLASDAPGTGQVPKWNTGGTITWEDDNSAAPASGDALSVNATAVSDSASLTNTVASGTVASTTWSISAGADPDPDRITVAIGAASGTDAGIITTGSQTIAGAKSFTGLITSPEQRIGSGGNIAYTIVTKAAPVSAATNWTANFDEASVYWDATNVVMHFSAISDTESGYEKSTAWKIRNTNTAPVTITFDPVLFGVSGAVTNYASKLMLTMPAPSERTATSSWSLRLKAQTF